MRIKKLCEIFPNIICTRKKPGFYLVEYRPGYVKRFTTVKGAYTWLKDNSNTTSSDGSFHIDYDGLNCLITTKYSNRHGYSFTHIWTTYSELQYKGEYCYSSHIGEMDEIGKYLAQM